MATLSAASASIFKIPTDLNPKPHDLRRFNPNRNPKAPQNPTATFTARSSNSSLHPPPTLIAPKQLLTPRSHRNPSTGYAVALLDFARSHHALESVSRDVRRLTERLRQGDALREVVERGKFHKYLTRLVGLLVGKSGGNHRGAVEMVGEVLAEFGRIYDELVVDGGDDRVAVVLVSAGVKMEIDQITRVAEKIQKMSGAAKVTVRQAVGW